MDRFSRDIGGRAHPEWQRSKADKGAAQFKLNRRSWNVSISQANWSEILVWRSVEKAKHNAN